MSGLPPVLRSERLLLRAWRSSDLDALEESWTTSLAHLRPWIPPLFDGPPERDALDKRLAGWIRDHERGLIGRYALWTPSEQLAGEVMFMDRGVPDQLEVGYWLDARHTGQGLAQEGVQRLLILIQKELGRHHVLFRCDEANRASIRVAAALGAQRSGEEAVDNAVLGHWLLAL